MRGYDSTSESRIIGNVNQRDFGSALSAARSMARLAPSDNGGARQSWHPKKRDLDMASASIGAENGQGRLKNRLASVCEKD